MSGRADQTKEIANENDDRGFGARLARIGSDALAQGIIQVPKTGQYLRTPMLRGPTSSLAAKAL
jgi:hypothetical protein